MPELELKNPLIWTLNQQAIEPSPLARTLSAQKITSNKHNISCIQNFLNQKWCTDFTYLFLTDGSKRYNCTIIDLYDRSVVANITNKHITADLAKRTLQKAIDSQPGLDTGCLILHSDQESQFTSKKLSKRQSQALSLGP